MKVVVERGRTVPFSELPQRSIALDGYTQGPEIDLAKQIFSFDHHDKCLRLVTRATCQQVMDALLLGLQPDGFQVFVNDVDGDTALSVWLLRNPEKLSIPKVRDLVESVGAIDAHGPAYPAQHPELSDAFFQKAMRKEQDARQDGSYSTCDLSQLLEECVEDIDAFVSEGLPPHPPPAPVPYEILRTSSLGWSLVRPEGFVFRDLYQDGVIRAVTVKELPGGTWQYSVAKKSDLVSNFPVGPASQEGTILHTLATKEPGWGGGSSIGGSPRHEDGSSSRLTPEEVFQIVDEVVKQCL